MMIAMDLVSFSSTFFRNHAILTGESGGVGKVGGLLRVERATPPVSPRMSPTLDSRRGLVLTSGAMLGSTWFVTLNCLSCGMTGYGQKDI